MYHLNCASFVLIRIFFSLILFMVIINIILFIFKLVATSPHYLNHQNQTPKVIYFRFSIILVIFKALFLLLYAFFSQELQFQDVIFNIIPFIISNIVILAQQLISKNSFFLVVNLSILFLLI